MMLVILFMLAVIHAAFTMVILCVPNPRESVYAFLAIAIKVLALVGCYNVWGGLATTVQIVSSLAIVILSISAQETEEE